MLDEVLVSKLENNKLENVCGIYVITNIVTNKIYIGSSKKIRVRRNGHLSDLRRGVHQNNILQNSWNKHGEGSFVFNIIERCEEKDVLDREQHYLDFYKSYEKENGYNLSANSRHISHGISPQREKCLYGHRTSIINNKRVCKICHANRNKPKLKTHCGAGHLFDSENTGVRIRVGAHGNNIESRFCKKCEKSGAKKRYKYEKKDIPLSKFCKAGHEYTPENTRTFFKGSLKCRSCRECRREWQINYRANKSKRNINE